MQQRNSTLGALEPTCKLKMASIRRGRRWCSCSLWSCFSSTWWTPMKGWKKIKFQNVYERRWFLRDSPSLFSFFSCSLSLYLNSSLFFFFVSKKMKWNESGERFSWNRNVRESEFKVTEISEMPLYYVQLSSLLIHSPKLITRNLNYHSRIQK